MISVVFHPAALEELEHAADYYEREREGLGRRFRLDFEASLERIVQNPLLFAEELGDFRACMLKRFPYTIFYIVLDSELWIAAVAHQSRKPGYWARRRPH